MRRSFLALQACAVLLGSIVAANASTLEFDYHAPQLTSAPSAATSAHSSWDKTTAAATTRLTIHTDSIGFDIAGGEIHYSYSNGSGYNTFSVHSASGSLSATGDPGSGSTSGTDFGKAVMEFSFDGLRGTDPFLSGEAVSFWFKFDQNHDIVDWHIASQMSYVGFHHEMTKLGETYQAAGRTAHGTGGYWTKAQANTISTPIPAALPLMVGGLALLGGLAARRRRAS